MFHSSFDNIIFLSISKTVCGIFIQMNTFYNTLLSAIPVVLIIFFIIINGVILISILKEVKEHFLSNFMEEKTIATRIVTKRTYAWGDYENTSYFTNYYVTFEDKYGNRMEFRVNNSFFDMYTEEDKGMLTHQGARFLHFERDKF